MAKHLIHELTEVAGMGLCGLVDGIEIKPIDRGLGQYGSDTAKGDQRAEKQERFAHL
jgi:hypothetical protein